MNREYERRLLRTLNSKNTNEATSDGQNTPSPRTSLANERYISDRYTPIRESPNWNIRFTMIQQQEGVKTPQPRKAKEASTDNCKDTIAYQCLLKNELLGAGIEDIKEQVEERRVFAPLTTRNLFTYRVRDSQSLVEPSSPYSLSPVSSKSQKLLRSPRKTARKISKIPYKVLDAPELHDDFYLNLVDWSSTNILSVGLGTCVYLWSACTSQVTRLCDLSSDNDSVTSVSWAERGHSVAVGTHKGLVQIWDVVANKRINVLEGQTARTRNIRVQVLVQPDIVEGDREIIEDQFLILGQDNQKVVCHVSSQPTSKIGWEKDGEELLKQRYSVTQTGLIVKGPVANDTAGLYKVTASILEHGILRTRNIRVQVLVQPEIVEFANYREIIEGERVTIDCRATGTPSPYYSFIDNRRRNLTLENGYSVDPVNGVLRIDSVKKDTERQFIRCHTRNTAGESSREMDLKVLTKPVIFQFNNVSMIDTTTSKWSCKARGDPVPEIEIVKFDNNQDRLDKQTLNPIGSRFSFERTEPEGIEVEFKLKISPVNRSDGGLYLCRAKNKAGTTETVGHIQVEFKPDLSQTNTNVKTWNSNPVNLTCIVEAIPNATISWRFNNEDIHMMRVQDSYTIYEGIGISHLEVKPNKGPYVYGTYWCSGENTLGKTTSEIKLSEAYRPQAPTIKVVKIRPTSIEIEIVNAISDLPIKKYYVKYWRESELDSEKQKVWPAAGIIYRLEDLTPTTRYRLSFAAESDVGIGDYTPMMVEKTPEESRPEKGSFLFDEEIEARQLAIDGYLKCAYGDRFHIRWNQAEDNGRAVTQYILKYYKVHKTNDGYIIDGDDSKTEVNVNARDSLEHTLRNLSPNSFYKVELYAVNSIGTSDPSELIFKTSATASSPSEWGQDLDYDESIYNMGTALISVAISLIIILIVMDIIFYIRCKVGVLYFIKSFIWPETSANSHKKAKSNDFQPGNLGSISEVKRASRSEIDNPAFDSNNKKVRSDELTPMMMVTDSRGDIHDRVNNHHLQQGIRKPKDSAV